MTSYVWRISDGSSDVCSSYLIVSPGAKELNESFGDAVERKQLVDSAPQRRLLGHAENHRLRLVRTDDVAACLPERNQAVGAVAAHAGHDHAHGRAAKRGRKSHLQGNTA